MPELRSRLTHAIVTAGDELAEKLVESGLWELVGSTPAPAPKKRAPRKAAAPEVESGE